jgi:hypothetical protein
LLADTGEETGTSLAAAVPALSANFGDTEEVSVAGVAGAPDTRERERGVVCFFRLNSLTLACISDILVVVLVVDSRPKVVPSCPLRYFSTCLHIGIGLHEDASGLEFRGPAIGTKISDSLACSGTKKSELPACLRRPA